MWSLIVCTGGGFVQWEVSEHGMAVAHAAQLVGERRRPAGRHKVHPTLCKSPQRKRKKREKKKCLLK